MNWTPKDFLTACQAFLQTTDEHQLSGWFWRQSQDVSHFFSWVNTLQCLGFGYLSKRDYRGDLIWDFSVIFHPSYHVPVLYWSIFDHAGRITKINVSDDERLVSTTMHPVTGITSYWVHPVLFHKPMKFILSVWHPSYFKMTRMMLRSF